MKKFKNIDGEEFELNGELEEYGILENEDGLYELCDKDSENSFTTVDVITENGIKYVEFNEISVWADSNIKVGLFEYEEKIMKKEEKKKLVKDVFEGYIEMAENEEKIIIDLNVFDEEVINYLEEKNIDNEDYSYTDDDEFLKLTSLLNEMLINKFKENGYDTYENGEFYAENGNFVNVLPNTVVAIKE